MKKTLLILFIAFLVSVIGCSKSNNSDTSDNETNPDGGTTGSLTLYIDKQDLSRQILPDISMDIVSYDIEGNGPAGAHFILQNQTGTLVTINYLATGVWNMAASGRNSANGIIGSGTVTVTVLPSVSTSASVVVRPLAGQGTLALNVTWPANTLQVPDMTGSVTRKGSSTPIAVPYTTSAPSHSAGASQSLDTGYYLLINKLYNNGVQVWDSIDAVRIARNRPSTGTWILQLADLMLGGKGSLDLAIDPEMENPILVSFNSTPANLVMGQNMTIAASTSESGIEGYRWYIDGDIISGANTNTITYGSALTPGVHRLYCVVEKGNVIGANGFQFNVVGSISHDSSLSSLTINPGTLTPAFATGTTAYTAAVGQAVTSIDVTPSVNESHASVSVNGVVITSGTPRTVALTEGANTITVAVVAQDTITTTNYVITVNKPVSLLRVYTDQPSYNLVIGQTITVDVMLYVQSSLLVSGAQVGIRTVNGAEASMLTLTSVVYKDAAHYFDWSTGNVLDAGGSILSNGMDTLALLWLSTPFAGKTGRFVTLTFTTSASATHGAIAPIRLIDFIVLDQNTNPITAIQSIINAEVHIQ